MNEQECWDLLNSARSAVLGTVHKQRGVDAVPVVFAERGEDLVTPVDRVKAKAHAALQRVRNIEADPRCVLLADHYSDDWTSLWWVRAHCRASVIAPERTPDAVAALAAKYQAYRDPDAIDQVIVLRVTDLAGWHAQS